MFDDLFDPRFVFTLFAILSVSMVDTFVQLKALSDKI